MRARYVTFPFQQIIHLFILGNLNTSKEKVLVPDGVMSVFGDYFPDMTMLTAQETECPFCIPADKVENADKFRIGVGFF